MSKLKRFVMILVVLVVLLGGTGISAQPAQASGCSYYHVVRSGESLSWIARWYGAYWPYLAQINHIPAPKYRIYPGQVLCIAYGGYVNPNPYRPTQNYSTQWNFSIKHVQHNSTVSIRTINFPSNVLFNAKIGRRSGGGYEWIELPEIDSGRGGSFEVEFTIPAAFHGTSDLAIRIIQQKKNGKVFRHEQWFSNIPGGVVNPHNIIYNPWPGTIPTIWIVGVSRNSTVTIQTANFPPNLDFQVLMGPMGTQGFGYHVTTFNSGAGGTMTRTFSIPPQLHGSYQISIRTQNQWSGYFSYNWFYNNSTY